MSTSPAFPSKGLALIADPIYDYIPFTVPDTEESEEVTEQDLIDTPWMQRLRRIHQLQSARWVYPSAEHSRFQHSLGTMHMAGRFARHLYPGLKALCKDVPSLACFEETFRIAGLLHDIGHGPYGHFAIVWMHHIGHVDGSTPSRQVGSGTQKELLVFS